MPPGLRSRDRVPGPYRFRLLGGACRGRDRPGHRGSVARTRRPGATRGEGTNVVTVTAILDLERAGFTREQVEALARLLETQTVTKTDLAEAKAELKADIAHLASELKLLEQRMTNKLGTLVVAVGGALALFTRLFPGGHP